MENRKDFLSLLSNKQKKLILDNLELFERAKNEFESISGNNENNQFNRYIQYYSHLNESNLSLFKDNEELMHDLFVKYCLAPEGYKTGNGEVFACVVGREKNNEDNYVNISVVTPSMAYIDSLYFSAENDNENSYFINILKEEYRPYYYEFTAVLSDEELKCFNSQLRTLKEKTDYTKESCFWFKAKLVIESQNRKDNYFGILNFGGSSSFSEALVFTSMEEVDTETLNYLNNNFKISISPNEPACNKYLNSYFKSFSQFKVKVFNVGQANCIYIENQKSTKHFFFDIGKPNDAYSVKGHTLKIENPDMKPGTVISNNLANIKTLPHELIIVSHWHLDHFASFKELKKHGINSTWILPKIDTRYDIKSAPRLLNYLVKNKANVYYLHSIGKIFDNNSIQLLCSTTARKSDPNTRSLMLRIRDTVFSADCLYEFWPDDLKNNLSDVKRLIVPHHCSKKNINKRGIRVSHNIINSFSNAPGKEAYISAGFNVYHHPNPDHIAELGNASFNIFFTKNTIDCYQFDIC